MDKTIKGNEPQTETTVAPQTPQPAGAGTQQAKPTAIEIDLKPGECLVKPVGNEEGFITTLNNWESIYSKSKDAAGSPRFEIAAEKKS